MPQEIRFDIRNDLRELARANELVNGLIESEPLPAATAYAAQLAVEEILSNVIRHAYPEPGRHVITVHVRAGDGQFELNVVDDGREFDPSSAPEVDLDVPLEERRVGGLGIHLVRKMAREIRYRRTVGRNHVRVRIGPARSS